MEIVRMAGGDYQRYEDLLLQRDQKAKEADQLQQEYIREFGEAITAVFEEKIKCIELRKAIAFGQAARNRGQKVDPAELKAQLETQMAAYYDQLRDLLRQRKAAESGTPITDLEVEKIKKIYRRLAKLLHPDISPLTREHPELMDLFQQVLVAYRCNDLGRLQELEVLIQRRLTELDAHPQALVIENIGEKIAALETEIHDIISTEPYTYSKLFEDAFAVEEKHNALAAELAQWQSYRAELQKIYDALAA